MAEDYWIDDSNGRDAPIHLTEAELALVSGCLTVKAQVEWFRLNGYPPQLRRDGWPIIFRREWLALQEVRPFYKKLIPEMSSILTPRKIGRNQSAVYFLLKDGEVVYVGKSVSVLDRMSQHVRSDKDWDEMTFLPVDADMLDTVEMEYIARLQPRHNKAGVKGLV